MQLLRELEDEDKLKEERELKKQREKEKKKDKKRCASFVQIVCVLYLLNTINQATKAGERVQ